MPPSSSSTRIRLAPASIAFSTSSLTIDAGPFDDLARRDLVDQHAAGVLSEGHVLVIPKEPAETMAELSDDAAAAVGRVLPRVTRAVMKVTGASAVNLLQNNGADAGQVVMHVHVHVIPRFPGREDGGLKVEWNAGDADGEALADLGRKIARLL
jgi:diadenosine tetraphosphate (Ap4A) HIT family hydrolase